MDHLHRLVGHWEGRPARELVGEELGERFGHVTPQRQHVLSPVLAVAGRDSHRGFVQIGQVEALRCQAPQLARPKAGFHRQAVQHRPRRSNQAAQALSALGGLDQQGKLVVAQAAAVMAAVEFDVVAGQVCEGVVAASAVAPKPSGELLDRPKVVVARLKRSVFGIAEVGHCHLNRRREQFADPHGLRQLQHLRRSRQDQLGLLGGRALGQERGVELSQMPTRYHAVGVLRCQRRQLGPGVLVRSGVDQAGPTFPRFRLQLLGQGFRRGLVAASLDRSPHAGANGVGDVPSAISVLVPTAL
ncbi:MAG TPA: hypothetical protein PLF81_30590, partial [Candidatus Anammoximicrobium sp.]|nr:hypothetical protein [Candidatus Anammoximicrobium sp.]